MYTSDSPFNIAQISIYMSIGFPVLPETHQNGIGSSRNGSQTRQLGTFSNDSKFGTDFERQVLSSEPLGPGVVTFQDLT